MSEEVASRIRAAIADHGPIGFDEYMEIALYGPGGFFEAPPVGASGHFVTSPHVHPYVFGHCLRDALLDAWFALGEIEPLPLVELGAGDGTLAEALLGAFGELPRPQVSYTGVEVSPGARDALEARGVATVRAPEDLEPFGGVVAANEVLDNLPFVPVRGTREGTSEVRVGLEGPALVEVEVPWSRPGVAPPRLKPGERSTIPVGAFAMLEALARVVRRGYVLLIDYGAASGPAGEVHGYREHRAVADVLADPGGTDITAGVDMGSVAAHAEALGLRAFEPVRQAAALSALGHDRWARTMGLRQASLQEAGCGAEAVRVWETRSRASLLVDPSRFGAFWWLVLATEGLPEPSWLARARAAEAARDPSRDREASST